VNDPNVTKTIPIRPKGWRGVLWRVQLWFVRPARALRGAVVPLIGRLWYTQAPTSLSVHIGPSECAAILAQATKPSIERLHLRDLFTEERKYKIGLMPDHLLMTCTTRTRFSRVRLPPRAILRCTFSSLGLYDGRPATQLTLHTHSTVGGLLDVIALPLLMGALLIVPWFQPSVVSVRLPLVAGLLLFNWLVSIAQERLLGVKNWLFFFLLIGPISFVTAFRPWDAGLVAALVLTLLALCWGIHWAEARLQAADMIYFVQRALEHIPAPKAQELSVNNTEAQAEQAFLREWQRAHRGGAGNASTDSADTEHDQAMAGAADRAKPPTTSL
jgi:hypothetical protein